MVGLQPFQRRVGRALDRFRRKILRDLALTATARFAMVHEIVADLGCVGYFIALFWRVFGDEFLGETVGISIGCIEQSNSELERLVHQRDRFALSELAPPAG